MIVKIVLYIFHLYILVKLRLVSLGVPINLDETYQRVVMGDGKPNTR